MISSVAYAEDEMLSEAKTASPLTGPMRSWISAFRRDSAADHRATQRIRHPADPSPLKDPLRRHEVARRRAPESVRRTARQR